MKTQLRRLIALLLIAVILVCPLTVSAETTPVSRNGKAPFRISCAVNGNTATQRGFCWYTAENTDSKVEIKTHVATVNAEVISSSCEEWNGNYVHKVTVGGLASGTAYSYRVGDGTNMSDYGTFTTDNGDSIVKFITVADVQASNDDNFLKGANTLRAALDTMPDCDFVANLGDFTNDSDNEEWDSYDKNFGALNLNYSIAPVAGNHDGLGVEYWFNNMFNLDTSEAVQVKDGVNYSFDYGNAHFAVLNTNDMFCMTIAQLNWLKNDMNSTDKDWKIVFMHKSPYTLGKDGKWPDALSLQRSLTMIADSCDVDLVMSGHDHMYLRTKPLKGNMLNENGTTYILSGTAGSKRYEIRKFLAGFFLSKKFIGALNVQRDDYDNFWDGESWENLKLTNVGGCYNTVTIDGGNLTVNSYILADEFTENNYQGQLANDAFFTDAVNIKTGETESRLVTRTDSYTITKETGKNKITFTGDNTTSEAEYALGIVPSFLCLAVYTFGEWLPKFLAMLPALLYSTIVEDTF